MTSLTLPASPTLRLHVRLARRRVARVAVAVRRREPTSPQLAVLLAGVLAVGIGVSIITTTDPFWWRLHFSELGTFHDFSGEVFNATLVVAGAVIVVFALRVRRDLRVLAARGHRRPRFLVGLMVAGGIQLATVGIVPVDTLTFLHDRAASGVMLCFAAVLLSVGREWRMLPVALRRTTGLVALALGAATPVFIVGLINLAAFEAIGFTLIFVWLGVFTTAVHGTATREPASAAGVATASVADIDADAAVSPIAGHRPIFVRITPLPASAVVASPRSSAASPTSFVARSRVEAPPGHRDAHAPTRPDAVITPIARRKSPIPLAIAA